MTSQKIISLTKQILNLFSWKNLFQFTCFLIIIALAYGFYENRNQIYSRVLHSDSIPNRLNVRLSAKSVNEVDDIVIKSNLIIASQITLVDFNKNTRIIIYSFSDNEILKKIINTFQENNFGVVPLFNSDSENNIRMSRLINGEFICTPYKDTIAYKLVPDASQAVEYVCANGIPPYYGKFTGIVSLYLKNKPTDAEVDQLRTLSRDLSISVFERDFR
jgi:hypothetical protein